ncbi:MAG: hypothetical protein ACREOC_18660, partial [Gemmatimonadales bacterium]
MLTRVLARLARHWFAPAPIRDLATTRIVMAAAMLLFFLPDRGRISRMAEGDPSTFRPLPALKVLM